MSKPCCESFEESYFISQGTYKNKHKWVIWADDSDDYITDTQPEEPINYCPFCGNKLGDYLAVR